MIAVSVLSVILEISLQFLLLVLYFGFSETNPPKLIFTDFICRTYDNFRLNLSKFPLGSSFQPVKKYPLLPGRPGTHKP